MIFLPLLKDQIVTFAVRLPEYWALIWDWLKPMLQKLPSTETEFLTAKISNFATDNVKVLGKIIGGIVSGGMAFVSLLSLVFITPIVSFYILRDWDKMITKTDNLLPRDHVDVIRQLLNEINVILSGFIRGQATVCLCLGLFYGIGLSLVGLDVGLIIGFISGLLSFIPYVGSVS